MPRPACAPNCSSLSRYRPPNPQPVQGPAVCVDTDEMTDLTALTGERMQQGIECHVKFRVE
ncbi:hypothetical protein [Thermochromatium tepidum]|uniref:Uncharacterized protein n=1 Tax=Thermochromatium tepidum ATCC 43061 TaxID=316276 RepID=A0A6I6E5H6_THETI|nr:hypothetical protein [Thermochromatium tepidum]QGU31708.1 hypothetical protein E6P07_01080 [Thermochromatium tepidum ATCC 43061]